MEKQTYRMLVVRHEGHKSTIAINNPPVNVLSGAVREELSAAFTEMGKKSVREVHITGLNGGHFSAGADLRELRAIVEIEDLKERERAAHQFSQSGQRLIQQVRALSRIKPVTAWIQGACTGGGFELALACSGRVLLGEAILGLPEVTLGIIPGWGGTALLTHLFRNIFWPATGTFFAEEWIAEGELFSTPEVMESFDGFACYVDDIDVHTQVKPKQRPFSPYANSLAEQAVREVAFPSPEPTEQDFRNEARLFAQALVHSDAREGIAAFLEKREAQFAPLSN